MATKTLAGTYASTVSLANYPGYVQFQVTGTVDPGVIRPAIYGNSSQAWTIANSGYVAGYHGVVVFGKSFASTVSNSGRIEATAGYGNSIELTAGGRVDNTGTIGATGKGVWISGGRGTVGNLGTIQSSSGDGVALSSGGIVINGTVGQTKALIAAAGRYGILSSLAAGAATIVNYGTVTASNTGGTGIELGSGGVVTNSGTGATIAAYLAAVEFLAGGSLVNAGSAVSAKWNGVYAKNSAATVTNSGSLTGYFDGVHLNVGGSVGNSGVVSGTRGGGIVIDNAPGTVTNSGLVSSSWDGIHLDRGGIVNNTGIVSSATASGVALVGIGGAVTNSGSGFIGGGWSGVWVDGGPGTVANLATISGTANVGVGLNLGGTVANGSPSIGTASIAGYWNGVWASTTAGPSRLVNYGIVTATGTSSTG